MMLNGQGMAANKEMAIALLTYAAEKGSAKARVRLQQIVSKGNGDNLQTPEATGYYPLPHD